MMGEFDPLRAGQAERCVMGSTTTAKTHQSVRRDEARTGAAACASTLLRTSRRSDRFVQYGYLAAVGRVTTITSTSIVITGPSGDPIAFLLSPTTVVRQFGSPSAVANLSAGQMVAVTVAASPSASHRCGAVTRRWRATTPVLMSSVVVARSRRWRDGSQRDPTGREPGPIARRGESSY